MKCGAHLLAKKQFISAGKERKEKRTFEKAHDRNVHTKSRIFISFRNYCNPQVVTLIK